MAKAFEVICKDCGEDFTYYTDMKNPCPHCLSTRKPEYKPGQESYGTEIEDLDEYE
jgi:hypothetical protein